MSTEISCYRTGQQGRVRKAILIPSLIINNR